MDEISDSVVDADLVWGSDFGDLRERLLETKDVDARFATGRRFSAREVQIASWTQTRASRSPSAR